MTRLSPKHANFSDPVGLLIRMVRSGDRAARAALIRELSGYLLTPLDRVLQLAEERRIRSAGPSLRPLVLIVGAPRAGTTLVYQVLAHYLPVTYFSNLSALFPRAPLTASRLFQHQLRSGHRGYRSYYGNTAGLAGPNDGFHVWNRWLGNDRYRAPQALTEDAIAAMRRFMAAWTQTFDRPLLNKNNRNADCVALLGKALPEAVFLVVRRDPIFVAQSLLVARQHVQGDKRRKWGLLSCDQATADPLGYVDSVCRQILEIERKLTDGCRTLSASRVIEIEYEDFCERPAVALEEVSRRVWGTPIDTARARRELDLRPRVGDHPRVTVDELQRIGSRLGTGSHPPVLELEPSSPPPGLKESG